MMGYDHYCPFHQVVTHGIVVAVIILCSGEVSCDDAIGPTPNPAAITNTSDSVNTTSTTTKLPGTPPCGRRQYYSTLNKCVYHINEIATWLEALTQCGIGGGTLLTVPDKPSYDWFKETYSPASNYKAWLAGSDAHQEGTWNWIDPSINPDSLITKITFSGAWKDFPARGGTTGPQNNCLGFVGLYWEDMNCQQKLGYYCEVKNADKCKINNGGCEHKCTPTLDMSRECSCKPGYELVNEIECHDIDECEVKNGDCEDICHNTPGGRNCSCLKHHKAVTKTKCEGVNQCGKNNGGCEQICVFEQGENNCLCKNGYTAVEKKCIKMASNAVSIVLVLIIMVSLSSIPVSVLVIYQTEKRLKKHKNMETNQKQNDEEKGEESDSDSETSSAVRGSNSSGSAGEKPDNDNDGEGEPESKPLTNDTVDSTSIT